MYKSGDPSNKSMNMLSLREVTGSLVVKAPDYSVGGCGFDSPQLLPWKGFFSRVSGFLSITKSRSYTLPPAKSG